MEKCRSTVYLSPWATKPSTRLVDIIAAQCPLNSLRNVSRCPKGREDSDIRRVPWIGDPEKGWFWAESKNLAHSVIGYHHRHLIREKMTLNTSVFEKCANTSPWGPEWAFRPNFQVFGCKIQFSGNKLAYIIIFVDDNLYLSVKEYHWTYNHNFWAL